MVHRYSDLLLMPGEIVVAETPCEAVSALRRILKRLGVAFADLVSLKTFRASKATAMVAAGDGLAKVLEAGDWRSHAFLAYVNESAVDKHRFLQMLTTEEEEQTTNNSEQGVMPPTEMGVQGFVQAAQEIDLDDPFLPSGQTLAYLVNEVC